MNTEFKAQLIETLKATALNFAKCGSIKKMDEILTRIEELESEGNQEISLPQYIHVNSNSRVNPYTFKVWARSQNLSMSDRDVTALLVENVTLLFNAEDSKKIIGFFKANGVKFYNYDGR